MYKQFSKTSFLSVSERNYKIDNFYFNRMNRMYSTGEFEFIMNNKYDDKKKKNLSNNKKNSNKRKIRVLEKNKPKNKPKTGIQMLYDYHKKYNELNIPLPVNWRKNALKNFSYVFQRR